jgi:hypothetical protein
MADTKITALTALTTADPANDMMPIVDVSDTTMAASGTTKRISINNILACSPSATLASATITGDLTVDTSTLKVASGSNQVGVGITTFTGTQSLQVLTGVRISDANPESLNCLNLAVTSTTSTIETRYGTPLIFGTNATECYRIAAGGTSTWSVGGSTAMTLNSTGLGVGGSPTNKLTIGTGSFNGDTVSGSASLYATVAAGMVILADGLAVATRGGVNNFIADTSGNLISRLTTTAPTLSDNGYMVFNLTSNTNLRITVKCNDGTTRTANITLAP